MAYDFSRFSTQSFERLIQALASAAVGATIQIYGAGKDGAREATYTGPCTIGSKEWDGYIVFQAKYHQVNESPVKNTSWLIKQIDQEMAKFADSKRALKRPDYYVIASNVRLSGAAADKSGRGQGGVDKVYAHLQGWAKKLGFRDVVVWHLDTISTLLDVHSNVRTLFEFWVQPGDVLAAILRKLAGPKHEDVLSRYLRNGLRQSREIKTRDIGQAIGRTVMLEEVFTDLPIDEGAYEQEAFDFANLRGDRQDIDDDSDAPEVDDEIEFGDESVFDHPRILARLMSRSADKFDPQSWQSWEDSVECDCRRNTPLPNRIVLLGGPGQGKSTIGQFLAQLCRARLLHQMRLTQTPEVNSAITAILKCAAAEGISLEGPLRYPFHIELPRFADALSEAQKADVGFSIVAYIAKQIAKLSEVDIDSAKLREWIGTIPTVIILDGLDEVPHSGNRVQVIEEIERLIDTLHEINADALIFSTSRPQGYQEELAPKLWMHWRLELLSPAAAIKLATRVAPILVSEDTRREEILSILAEAAEEETTAPLMTSPLQVMLLFQLVSTHNNIPKDRWTLFYRHYETLRDREIAKGGPSGTTIGRFKSQIDRIHYDAGYLLHLRAESAGGANAYFTVEEFADLVGNQLASDGFDDVGGTLAVEIADLATNRLVFLRSQIEGQIAFDVRSLQEFMAAARLTTSPESSIKDRLFEIAGRAHWLHVFKIACSKIFASTAHEALRETVIALIDSLDAGDRSPDDRIVRTGANLALQLLADGTAASLPLYRKKLISRAVRVLSVPQRSIISSLARVLDLSQNAILEPIFVEAINCGDDVTRRAALRLLALLTYQDKGRHFAWIEELLVSSWPNTSSDFLEVFDSTSFLAIQGDFVAKSRKSQWQAEPKEVASWVGDLGIGDPEEADPSPDVIVCGGLPRLQSCRLIDQDGVPTDFSIKYFSMTSAIQVDAVPDDALPVWHVAKAAADFSNNPSIGKAAAFMDQIIDRNQLEETKSLALPWVLHALVFHVDGIEALRGRKDEVVRGRHGNPSTWREAEVRWQTRGLMQIELFPTNGAGGIPSTLAKNGAPPLVGRVIERSGSSALVELLALAKRKRGDSWVLNTLLFYFVRNASAAADEKLIDFLKEIPISDDATSPWLAGAWIKALPDAKNRDELINRLRKLMPIRRWLISRSMAALDTLTGIFLADPTFREVLQPIAMLHRAFYRGPNVGGWKISEKMIFHEESDTNEVASSVASIRILEGWGTQGPLEDVRMLMQSEHPSVQWFLHTLSRNSEEEGRLPIVLELSREVLIRKKVRAAQTAYEKLSDFVEARPVNFTQRSEAERLNLPEQLLPPMQTTTDGDYRR
ncbi:NACHT domain-containing protein [Mesorhizobium sp. CA7]|uniref:NACHT domain-containing protein n=1 Tax=Mesorhizobium sp. CA7 TaxID=588501 RepID=UPI001CC9EC6F|nr:hypothetical protein [Mesorhizobium sp. CA7]MBZ9816781.1 hypothetical protein [Mesorhizobium sp. CA7]